MRNCPILDQRPPACHHGRRPADTDSGGHEKAPHRLQLWPVDDGSGHEVRVKHHTRPLGARQDFHHSRSPFAAAYYAINERRDIGAAAKLVHAHLVTLHRTGRAQTQTEIGDALGMSRHQVWRAIDELVAVGLVQTIRYGLGRPNSYVLLGLDEDDLNGRASGRRPGGQAVAGGAGPSRAGTYYPKKPTKKGKYTAVHDGRCSGCGGNHEVTACPTWAGAIRT